MGKLAPFTHTFIFYGALNCWTTGSYYSMLHSGFVITRYVVWSEVTIA